ncbi:MAG: PH domain-containing protein [Tetrasphaera sp.]|nr:PH domain-containing protein [Tetrasphaera sp.]
MTTDAGQVTLRGNELPWQGVSGDLANARLIVLGLILAVPVLATAVLAILVSPWIAIATGVLALAGAWAAFVIVRQVSAISWIELPEELVIRKGRILRSLVSIPYGRLQYVDIASGPIARHFGLATCEIHTASPQSGGSLPGLPSAVAEELRSRLAARGEAQRAGL